MGARERIENETNRAEEITYGPCQNGEKSFNFEGNKTINMFVCDCVSRVLTF